MFGDVSAWIYQYLAGIKPDSENPGFEHVLLQPYVGKKLDWVKSIYRSPFGVIKSEWQRTNKKIEFTFELPVEVTACLILLGDEKQILREGLHIYN